MLKTLFHTTHVQTKALSVGEPNKELAGYGSSQGALGLLLTFPGPGTSGTQLLFAAWPLQRQLSIIDKFVAHNRWLSDGIGSV